MRIEVWYLKVSDSSAIGALFTTWLLRMASSSSLVSEALLLSTNTLLIF